MITLQNTQHVWVPVFAETTLLLLVAGSSPTSSWCLLSWRLLVWRWPSLSPSLARSSQLFGSGWDRRGGFAAPLGRTAFSPRALFPLNSVPARPRGLAACPGFARRVYPVYKDRSYSLKKRREGAPDQLSVPCSWCLVPDLAVFSSVSARTCACLLSCRRVLCGSEQPLVCSFLMWRVGVPRWMSGFSGGPAEPELPDHQESWKIVQLSFNKWFF